MYSVPQRRVRGAGDPPGTHRNAPGNGAAMRSALRLAMVCTMQQLVTRVDDQLAAAIDVLVSEGVFASRSDAVREGLRVIVDRHRRAQVASEIVDAYRAQPQTDDQYSWTDDATREMIADEPW